MERRRAGAKEMPTGEDELSTERKPDSTDEIDDDTEFDDDEDHTLEESTDEESE